MNRIIILVVGCLPMYNMAFAQTPTFHNDRNWQLHWEDNFTSLNTNIWDVRHNYDADGDPCVFIDSNVSIDNNTLVLRTKKETSDLYCCLGNYINQWDCKRQWLTDTCYQYTGAYMRTKPAYNTKYGYMEAKIKMTYRTGVGYAFWTFRGINQNYSSSAEIDIFETLVPRLQQGTNALSTCIHTCYEKTTPCH